MILSSWPLKIAVVFARLQAGRGVGVRAAGWAPAQRWGRDASGITQPKTFGVYTAQCENTQGPHRPLSAFCPLPIFTQGPHHSRAFQILQRSPSQYTTRTKSINYYFRI